MNKLLALLGLARRAGLLAPGFGAVKAAVLKRKARLVLTACDLSERTVRELDRLCAQNGVSRAALSADSFSVTKAVGIKCGCLALCDSRMADRAKELLRVSRQALPETEEECGIC